MNATDTLDYVGAMWDDHVIPALCRYIRIPNKSPMFDADWERNGHMSAAVALLEQWCRVPGVEDLKTEVVTLPGRTPLLFCESPSTGGDGTVLLYGHYDKQPEFVGWADGLGPWNPFMRDGRLYGRGGADDGYALFASLTAIAALDTRQIPRGRCVIMIEGCEESGSYDLPHYVAALGTRIGRPDLVICLDAECGNYDQLWVTTSLRGMLPGTLTVQILKEGIHSGVAGGIVPSTFRILRTLYERVENARTGRLHESLYTPVPADAKRQLERAAQVLGADVVKRFPWTGGAGPGTDDTVELLLRNAWHPSLATVGLSGAPDVGDAGNTLRPSTSARLVFRLPPTLDAGPAASAIKQVLEADPPYGAKVTFDVDTAQTGWAAPPQAAWLAESLERASMAFFSSPVMHMGMGGTIPFMKMLGDAFPDVQFLVTGVLGPHSNAHGPNEFLHIETGKRITGCVAQVLADQAVA